MCKAVNLVIGTFIFHTIFGFPVESFCLCPEKGHLLYKALVLAPWAFPTPCLEYSCVHDSFHPILLTIPIVLQHTFNCSLSGIWKCDRIIFTDGKDFGCA